MPGIVHVKKRLTDISLRFPAEQDYCGQDFFPRKSVEHMSDFIVKWSKANILRLDDLALSAPDDELPPEVELVLSADDQYQCRVYAVRSPDKVLTRKNADPAIDYDVERALMVRQRLDIRLEYLRVKQVLRNPALLVNNQTLTSTQQFDHPTSADALPVTIGRAIVANLRYANGGNPPNVVRMTTFVKNAIVESEEFKDFTKFNVVDAGRPIGDEDLIAAVWGLRPGSVKCTDAVYNVNPVNQTPQYRTFIGSDIVFGYVTAPGIRTYGLGVDFRFSGYNTDPYAIIAVPQFNRGAIPGEDIRGLCITDPHIYNADSGFLLRGCINVNNPAYNGLVD